MLSFVIFDKLCSHYINCQKCEVFSHHTILRTSKPLLSELNVSLLLLNIVTCPLLSQNCLSVQLKAFGHFVFISINWPLHLIIVIMNIGIHIIFMVIHHLYWMQRMENRQQNVDLKQADLVHKWPQEKVEQQQMMELHKISYCYFLGQTKKNEKKILGINGPKAVSL